jgi:uncharacterized protein (TIGR00255 family)
MTAYALAHQETPLGPCEGQLHCVNRKYLELRLDLPQPLRRFEAEIRKDIASKIQRGQVTLSVTLPAQEVSAQISLNLPLVHQLAKVAKQMAVEVGFAQEECFHSLLRTSPLPLLLMEERGVEEKELKKSLFSLVDQLIAMALTSKEEEGAFILQEITPRIERLALYLEVICQKAPLLVQTFRNRLKERLLSILEEPNELKERLLREVAIYADRVDISEELARFAHHYQLLKAELAPRHLSSAKRIEFILQELLREANTIASKAGDPDIAQAVVDIKSEIEKIREQIQNVE